MPVSLITHLRRHFRECPDRLFCRMIGGAGETVMTWRDLDTLAHRFVGSFNDAGLAPGDEVLIFVRHRPELYGALFGAMLGGFVPSCMPCTSPRQDPGIYWSSHRSLIERMRPAAIVADRATFDEMRQAGLDLSNIRCVLLEDLGPEASSTIVREGDDIALLQHSSGTTGLKKGVVLSHDAIISQIESYAAAIEIEPADVIVSWLPLYHDMGLIACCIMPAYLAIPIVHIDPFTWLARPEALFDAITAHDGTLVWQPNFAFEHMALVAGRHAAGYDLSKVRAFINCSEPCKPEAFDRFASAFAASGVRQDQLQCCYAMAETVFAVSHTRIGQFAKRIKVDAGRLNRGQLVVPGEEGRELIETGRPIAGIALAVYDEQRRVLPNPAVGEIGISGDFLFTGYNKDPRRTADRLVDGVYFSGDLGFILDGHVYVLGRVDDLIIVNGRNIYAHEVEAIVAKVDGVKPGRSVAIAVFDAKIGSERLIVISELDRVSTRAEPDIRRDIMRIIHSTVEVTPWQIHLVDEGWLIKTTSGKISRTENLARLQAEAKQHD